MGKHVCPICEDVYAQRGEVTATTNDTQDVYEAWHCPACNYAFVGYADVEKLTAIAASLPPDKGHTIGLTRGGDGVVRRRPA